MDDCSSKEESRMTVEVGDRRNTMLYNVSCFNNYSALDYYKVSA